MERLSRSLGQSSIEYVMLISIVVAALMAMSVYVQRANQANIGLIKLTPEPVKDSFARFGP